MCVRTETIYKDCACTIPETEWCPRCPDEGCEKCKDFKTEVEMKNGVCLGLGPCPFYRCKACDSDDEGSEIEGLDEKPWLAWEKTSWWN